MVLEPEITIINEIEIAEAFIRMRSDGIVYVYYKENVTLTVELQMRMVKLYEEITNKQKAYFIFDFDEGFVMTTEARNNSIKLEENTPVKASGIIVRNLASRLIANFFIRMNKPKIEYKLFGNVNAAAEWLRSLN